MLATTRLSLLLGTLFTLAGAANAVPFDLQPPTFAEPQVKVAGPLPSYDIVCDNRVRLECDLAPGRYQVQEFDVVWNVSKRIINLTEGGRSELALTTLFQRSFTCDGTDYCQARCDTGQDALGGNCTANVDGVAIPILGISHQPRFGTTSGGLGGQYACETDQPATIEVGITCASRRVPVELR